MSTMFVCVCPSVVPINIWAYIFPHTRRRVRSSFISFLPTGTSFINEVCGFCATQIKSDGIVLDLAQDKNCTLIGFSQPLASSFIAPLRPPPRPPRLPRPPRPPPPRPAPPPPSHHFWQFAIKSNFVTHLINNCRVSYSMARSKFFLLCLLQPFSILLTVLYLCVYIAHLGPVIIK